MKLYISGPIKGAPAARDTFRAAEDALLSAGHEPVNPFDCAAECGYSEECPGEETDAHYDHYLRGDLIEMLACDGVALLDGWEASRGARIEQTVAVQVGMPVRRLSEWLPTANPYDSDGRLIGCGGCQHGELCVCLAQGLIK